MTIPSARVPKCPECSSARVLRYLECPSSLRALGASSPAYLGYPSVLSGLSAQSAQVGQNVGFLFVPINKNVENAALTE